jgi:hypothetical protein
MTKNTKTLVWGGLIGLLLYWLWQKQQARKA